MSKTTVKNILNMDINTADFYTIATTVHKNHKKKKLKIKGTYLEALYKDTNRVIKVKKSTQAGVSEWLAIRAIIRARDGLNVFYVFPTYVLKNQFVKERINKSIMYTRYYSDLQKNDDSRIFESLDMKMFGKGTIAFVGSNSQVSFLSFPADDVIIDERNQCNEENIGMAKDRQGNSKDKTNVIVANPTYEGFGIDLDYEESNQNKWCIKCSCGEWVFPDFFKHVLKEIDDKTYIIRDKNFDPHKTKDVNPICHKCGKAFNRLATGEWVPHNKHNDSGYHISKLFAGTVTLREMVDRFDTGLKDENEMQHCFNNDMGLSYTAKGAKIDDSLLNSCVRDYNMPDNSTDIHIAGIDVGNMFNIIIADVNLHVHYVGETPDIKDIIMLIKKYNVRMFVIDAMPEKRTATKLVYSMKRGFMCFYSNSKKNLTYDLEERTLSVDRTFTLDAVKESIVTEGIKLPQNAKTIKNFYEQMTSSTRVFDEKKKTYDWVHNKPDHYFHAMAYLLLAKKILVAVT